MHSLNLLRPIPVIADAIYIPFFAETSASPDNIALLVDGSRYPIEAISSEAATRLSAVIEVSSVPASGGPLELTLMSAGDTLFSSTVTVPSEISSAARKIASSRQRRLKFVRDNLACTSCGTALDSSECRTCGARFHQETQAVNAVADGGYRIPAAIDTSLCVFDTIEIEAIEQAAATGGMVLNFGAGIPSHAYDNVINLEIADMPCTDVVSVSDRLPFVDNTFDVVIALHVLEHVQRPWITAQELERVLKPGGIAIVTVPYVCQVHGFPHHYFNPTPQGLKSLFDGMQVVAHTMKGDAHPINSVQQILGCYNAILPPDARAEFAEMTVGALLSMPLAEAVGQSWARAADENGRWLIPAHTTLTVQKAPLDED